MSSEPVPAPPSTAPLTRERMRADIALMLREDPSEIGDDDSLIDLGLDSIRAMALVQRWKDAGARVDFAAFAADPRLGAWWAIVARALGAC